MLAEKGTIKCDKASLSIFTASKRAAAMQWPTQDQKLQVTARCARPRACVPRALCLFGHTAP
eukprot:10136028-Alexandrium_andersonii.AAC.1